MAATVVALTVVVVVVVVVVVAVVVVADVAVVVFVVAAATVVAAPVYPLEFHNSARCEISVTPPETPPLILQREREIKFNK